MHTSSNAAPSHVHTAVMGQLWFVSLHRKCVLREHGHILPIVQRGHYKQAVPCCPVAVSQMATKELIHA